VSPELRSNPMTYQRLTHHQNPLIWRDCPVLYVQMFATIRDDEYPRRPDHNRLTPLTESWRQFRNQVPASKVPQANT